MSKDKRVYEYGLKNKLDSVLALKLTEFQLPWTKRMLVEEVSHPDHFGIGAWVGSTLIGVLFSRTIFDENWLFQLAVAKPHRGQGVGSSLLKLWLHWGEGQKIKSSWLEVNEKNPIAIKLYGKLGFKTIGKRSNYYRGGRDAALVMRKSV